MVVRRLIMMAAGLVAGAVAVIAELHGAGQQPQTPPAPDVAQILVDRLDLERYKATIRGLTQFGDRREGTQRNRDAVAWIENQLRSYGCETDRMTYEVAARGGGAGRAGNRGAGTPQPPATILTEPNRRGTGGSTYYGITRPTGVNNDPMRQPNEKLRALNMEPVLPDPIPQVFCTKWGTSRRGEMYIIGGHMDGIGYGEAANDDASGSAIVMELARILSMPDVTTDVTIRFALWNGEEGGSRGATAYVNQRQKLQGQSNEPKWLGMIQHDMMMWDHGMPRADGSLSPEQRPEADFNIEFQANSRMAADSRELAFAVKAAADKYSKNYPGAVGPHMTNTDSDPFMGVVAAVSLRENERGMQTGAGWNPHWHQPTDLFATFSDKDFTLGLNSAQATLGAIATLSNAAVQAR